MNTWTTNLTPPNEKKNKKPWPHNKNDQPRNWKEFGLPLPPKKEKKTTFSFFPPLFSGTLPNNPSLHNSGAHQGEEFTLETRQFRSQHRQQDQGGGEAVRPVREKPDQPETPFGWGCWNWQQKIPEGWLSCCFFLWTGALFSGVSLEFFFCVAKIGGVVKRNIHVSNICLRVFFVDGVDFVAPWWCRWIFFPR